MTGPARRPFPWQRLAFLVAGLFFVGVGGVLTYVSYLRVCSDIVSVREVGDRVRVRLADDDREFYGSGYPFKVGEEACHHRRDDARDLIPPLINRSFKIISPAMVLGGGFLLTTAVRRRPPRVADDDTDWDDDRDVDDTPPPAWPAPDAP